VKRTVSSAAGLFLSLVLLSLVFYAVDSLGWLLAFRGGVEAILVPVEKIVYSSSRIAVSPLEFVRFARTGTARIADLERQVAQLSVDAARIFELEKENEAMRKLLGASLPPQWKYIPAAVVSKGEKLALGVGEMQGIKVGETVVWQDILLGTVVSVSNRQSSVRLLLDPESRIPAYVPRSGADGLVIGRFNSQIILTQVLQAGDLKQDDLLLTSGGSDLPRGLIIGKIGKIISDETDVYKEALVEPIVDLGSLDTVFVVRE